MSGKSLGLLAMLMICACQALLAADGGGGLFRGVADVPAQEGPTGVQVDPRVSRADVELASAVRASLSSSAQVSSGRIVVFARGGTVTLSGTIETAAAKDEAEYLAGRVRGTAKVINSLRVRGRVS